MDATDSAAKFDPARAGDYDRQSRIALAGYEACHELTACILAAALGAGRAADILVVGAGTAQEVVSIGALEPDWRFTALDPSAPMLDLARARLEATGLAGRVVFQPGYVTDLAPAARFDAATLIGVLHHLPGLAAKRAILAAIAAHLPPGAPLVLAGNYRAYASQPLLMAAWGNRWRMQGATAEEVEARLGKILQGADPPESEAMVVELLAEAGFAPPTRFFASLFWGAWIAHRLPAEV